MKRLIWIVLIAVMLLNLTSCAVVCPTTVNAISLSDGIEAQSVNGKEPDREFITSQTEFALKLFKKSMSEEGNTLVSPTSVMLALAMTANGAANDTKNEIETVLGTDIESLNQYLYKFINSLPSNDDCTLSIANSIWLRDDEDRLTVKDEFLQANADYYSAEIYKAPFDNSTVKAINNWVDINTEGLIDSIIDQIDQDEIMHLINALAFDAKWLNEYTKYDVYESNFTTADGTRQKVNMMSSSESTYIETEYATGFKKPYKGGKYSFTALLPDKGVDIYEFIEGMNISDILNNGSNTSVDVNIPKFKCDYKLELSDILNEMGMPTAFNADTADFSSLGQSTIGNIFISKVMHKTHITVDEAGTKAAAVTDVYLSDGATSVDNPQVSLDRPFVYMITENSTGLPIFIGAVTEIN